MKNNDVSLKWYEKLLIVPYLGLVCGIILFVNLLDGTYSKAEKKRSERFDEGFWRTNDLYRRYQNLTPNQLLEELQSIHAESQVILAVPINDWGMGFYEIIVKICKDPNLTIEQSEQLVEMAGWDEFRNYTQDNSARMELLLTAKRIGLTEKMLPTIQSLLKMIKAEEVAWGTHRSADHATELKLLNEIVQTLECT